MTNCQFYVIHQKKVVKGIKNANACAVVITTPKHISSMTGFSVTFVNFEYTKIAQKFTCVPNAGKEERKN